MLIKQGSTYVVGFEMIDSADSISGKAGLAPTVSLSKAGAGGGAPSGLVHETDAANLPGCYHVHLDGTDTNTVGELWLYASAAGANPTSRYLGYVAATGVGELATNAVSAAVIADGAIDAATFAAGAIDAAAIANGAIDNATFAADVGSTAVATNIIGQAAAKGAWDSLKASYVAANSFGALVNTDIDATISSRSTYAGGAVASVTGAVGSVAGDVSGKVLGGGAGAIAATGVQAQLPTGAIITTTFGAGAIDAAAIGTAAIDADAIATDAFGALELAAGAAAEIADAVWDEATAGHVAAGTFGAWVAGLGASIWDALTATFVTAGSIGKRIADYLDVAVSSRATPADVTITPAMVTAAGYATPVAPGLSGMDFDGIRARVKFNLNRYDQTTVDAEVDYWINAECRQWHRGAVPGVAGAPHAFSFCTSSYDFTTVDGTGTYWLPADFLRGVRMVFTVNDAAVRSTLRPLPYLYERWLGSSEAAPASGNSEWGIDPYNNQFTLYPTPDAAYTGRLYYVFCYIDLVNGSDVNPFTVDYWEGIVAGATARGLKALKVMEAAQVWEAEANKALAAAIAADGEVVGEQDTVLGLTSDGLGDSEDGIANWSVDETPAYEG